jgi:hypothetical protein
MRLAPKQREAKAGVCVMHSTSVAIVAANLLALVKPGFIMHLHHRRKFRLICSPCKQDPYRPRRYSKILRLFVEVRMAECRRFASCTHDLLSAALAGPPVRYFWS